MTNTRKKSTISNDTIFALFMLSPNVILFFVFMLFPIIWALIMSLNDYDFLTPMKFTGLKNYITIFKDKTAIQCLRNTAVYTLMTVPAGMILSLVLAVFLDGDIKFKRFFRAAYFLPAITSSVVVAITWQWLLNTEFGFLNFLLSLVKIPPVPWLTKSGLSLVSVAIVGVWKGMGYTMLIFLAGLQSIPSVYYEASLLDGASSFQQFIKITIPLLVPTTFFVFITSIIGSFQNFDIVNLMTGGGPGRSSSVIAHYLYQNAFGYFKMGYASAQSYILFFIIMGCTVINMWFERKSHSIY